MTWAAHPAPEPVLPVAASPAPPIGSPPARASAGETLHGKEGPWGLLEYTPMSIAPARDVLQVDGEIRPTRWSFPLHTRPQVEAVLATAGLTPAQIATLAAARWEVDPRGASIVAPADLILAIPPQVRASLYAFLARYPENAHGAALAFAPDELERRLASSGLTPASVGHFRRLLYRRGDTVFFADDRTLLPLLADRDQRIRAVGLLARQSSYAVRLKLDARSNIEQLLQYWGKPGRSKDLEPILTSLAGVPGGYALDLAHLLPPIPRRRVYTYPRRSTPGDEAKNCHWTSLNFFAEVADDRLLELDRAAAEVKAHYRPVTDPTFGDVVVLVHRQSGAVVHSATYLADELVFTKNGFGLYEPWMYMRLPQMIALYDQQLGETGAVKVLFYRRRNLRS